MKSINRILSEPLSGLFAKSGLHPNSITLMSGAAGLVAFLFFCIGSRMNFIIGALFFELFYVLDNCDGEVARAKGLSSKLGSWLDTMVDYVVHVIGFGGIMLGVYRQNENPVIFIAGIAAMIGIFLSFFVVILQKTRNYGLAIHGMPKAPGGAVKQLSFWDKLIDVLSVGDFSLVVIIFAVFGKMEVLLWLAAAGANLFCVILLAVNFKYLIGRE